MNTAGAVSFIWHATDNVALRPELGFASAKLTNSAIPAESRSLILSPGISALFYLGPREDFRMYVSPRYVYSRTRNESESPVNDSEQTLGTHLISGSVGAEYKMHRRFAAFGEVGLSYGRSKPPSTTTQTWAIRSVAGAILYF